MESFDATGASTIRATFDTGIDVEVPPGETRYYLVIYEGNFGYYASNATPSNDSFYADWAAVLVDEGKVLRASAIARTGHRVRWDSFDDYPHSVEWNTPYLVSWIIELDSGTHSLDIAIRGYSGGTMDYAYVNHGALWVYPQP